MVRGKNESDTDILVTRRDTRFFSMFLTQKPESGLKLADVVEFDPIAQPWNKFGGSSRFSKFHAKFWGESMVDEEREWLNLKTQSPDHSTDDVIMDDTDDEFISGCYELDISPNPVSDVEKIWIRADYIRVYKYTESKYNLCYKRRRAQSSCPHRPAGNR